MLKFALERLKLPGALIKILLSLFINRTNQVATANGPTPHYRVRIGIDQGEIISPLLWVIYIDPLLTVLKSSMVDPYSFNILNLPTSFSPTLASAQPLQVNNLVFMNDSTLIASSKAGPEHMLSITEKFVVLQLLIHLPSLLI